MPGNPTPTIIVLAGTNGGGKSSVGGEALLEGGMPFSNPDAETRKILAKNPWMDQGAANAEAWHQNRIRLEQAIEERQSYTFETTLGGNTITGLLLKASNVGLPVRMWYVGLSSTELHIQRVRERVERGGHDIPEEKIRQRYENSRQNLILLLPHLAELKLYDNSEENPPEDKQIPRPRLLLHLRQSQLLHVEELEDVPEWAKPIVAAGLKLVVPAPE